MKCSITFTSCAVSCISNVASAEKRPICISTGSVFITIVSSFQTFIHFCQKSKSKKSKSVKKKNSTTRRRLDFKSNTFILRMLLAFMEMDSILLWICKIQFYGFFQKPSICQIFSIAEISTINIFAGGNFQNFHGTIPTFYINICKTKFPQRNTT